MRAPKWLESVGHVLLGAFLPAVSAWREWRQWPPAVDRQPVLWAWPENLRGPNAWGATASHLEAPAGAVGLSLYVSWDRTRDAYNDFTEALAGAQGMILILAGLAAWGWLR